jgi:signal transduction histidine kinase
MKRIKTLRVRFALWTAGLMLIVLVLFGTFVYISLWQGLANSIDDSIKLSTTQAIAAVNIENGQINFSDSLPNNSAAEFRDRGLTIRILSSDGTVLQSVGPFQKISVDSNGIQNANAKISSFATTYLIESDPIRVYTAPIMENQNLIGVIQVMQSLGTLYETLNRLLLALLISIPVLLFVSALSGYFLASRALSPIDQITRTAQRISTEDLSARLNLHGTDDEIGRLATTFDNMLVRLEDGFERERQFTSDASHELRTPRAPEDYETALEDLSEETDHLRALTENLLYVARGDMRPAEPHEIVDLSALLIDVSGSLRQMAESKGLDLNHKIQNDLLIKGDSDALIRVFVNLLDNAIKYTDKGVINITATDNGGDYIEILISDTGRGIDSRHLPHIFERFYRVDQSRATEGFGLGLAIVQEIVGAHQGTIKVTSQFDSGTIFRLSLPKAKPAD